MPAGATGFVPAPGGVEHGGGRGDLTVSLRGGVSGTRSPLDSCFLVEADALSHHPLALHGPAPG
jgi:hypothetical protein